MDFNENKLVSGNLESEDDNETDLELDEDSEVKEQRRNSVEEYQKHCRRLKVTPSSYFMDNYYSSSLQMAYRMLAAKDIRTIANSLKCNKTIQEINLSNNLIKGEGTKYISAMLKGNSRIHNVNLSHNSIQLRGAEALSRMLPWNSTLTMLDLAYNGLRDKSAAVLATALYRNYTLKTLSLSGNEFCVEGGRYIGELLLENQSLEYLDLSWNHVRQEGALSIAKGLAYNTTLKHLDISWNGFADDGTAAIGTALGSNQTLEELDLSNNRVTTKGAHLLSRGLRFNNTLNILKLRWNPLGSRGVTDILKSIDESHYRNPKELYLDGVAIDYTCKNAIDSLLNAENTMKIEVGDITSGGPMTKSKDMLRQEVLEILKEYLLKNRLRMLDLFNQWDKDKSMSLTTEEFRRGIRACKIPLSDLHVKLLIEWLDEDCSDEVEYNEFVAVTDLR